MDKKTYRIDSEGVATLRMTSADKKGIALLDSIGWGLRKAYDFIVHTFKYYRGESEIFPKCVPSGESHVEFFSNYGLTKHNGRYQGNCYVFNATFLKLANLLGYKGRFCEGSVNENYVHAWAEVTVNGTVYVFDPEFEWNMIYHRGDNTKTGYMISYGQKGTWKNSNKVYVA